MDIAPRPEAVQVEPGLVETLVTLRGPARRSPGPRKRGRRCHSSIGFLAPARLDAAGLHGVERRGPMAPCPAGGRKTIRRFALRSRAYTRRPPRCRRC